MQPPRLNKPPRDFDARGQTDSLKLTTKTPTVLLDVCMEHSLLRGVKSTLFLFFMSYLKILETAWSVLVWNTAFHPKRSCTKKINIDVRQGCVSLTASKISNDINYGTVYILK